MLRTPWSGLFLVVWLLGVHAAQTATAYAPFLNLRIGDNDNFGFAPPPQWSQYFTAFVSHFSPPGPFWDFDGSGVIGPGDDFAVGAVPQFASGSGFSPLASTPALGAEFTDVALSNSYPTSSANSAVVEQVIYAIATDQNGNVTGGLLGLPQGPGRLYPQPLPQGTFPPAPLGTMAEFHFPSVTIDQCFFRERSDQILYNFNMVIADVDLAPVTLEFSHSGASAPFKSATISPTADGSVRLVNVSLSGSEVVFPTGNINCSSAAGHFQVQTKDVRVRVVAPNETYLAIDLAEISVLPTLIPEPSSSALLVLAVSAALAAGRVRKSRRCVRGMADERYRRLRKSRASGSLALQAAGLLSSAGSGKLA